MQEIEIYIDEIVLHGFAGKDIAGMEAAIQTELERLVREQGFTHFPGSSKVYDQVQGGSITVNGQLKMEQVGRHIAGTVYSSINKPAIPVKK